ncbi:MAG: hypothetical protein F4Z05_04780 [Chloroflexi bacterium]|nr:hypothetical protein [Chloroflexota bacterium]
MNVGNPKGESEIEMTRQLEIKQPFNLELSLMMGQAFRWRELGDGWFSGVLGENLVHVRQNDGGIEYRVGGPEGERRTTDADDAMLRRYFREDDDVAAIYADISRDPKVATIIEEFPGLRILRQDPWECTVAYLCSANNNVKRIGTIVETIAGEFGHPLELAGDASAVFPTPDQILADPDRVTKLKKMQLGLNRDKNIVKAAHRFVNGGLVADVLRNSSYQDVMPALMEGTRHKSKPNGIGPKVADCIALFSLDQLDAFPVDLWVWRAITEAYPEWGFPENTKPSDLNLREASEQARQVFGKYAGYANQYLFYWRRRLGEEPLPFGTRWRGKLRITPPGGRQLDDRYLDELRYEYLKAKYLSC